MLVRCDVCGAEPAAVLCCADEAALCSGCDRRVHRANKLADKHRRIPLLHPSSSGDSSAAAEPLCDVCKERRGLVFCVEDRAILCADCDDPIHSANELTAKHTRFLLVGAKLSAATLVADHQPPPASPENGGDGAGEHAAAIPAQSTKSSAAPDCSNGGGISSGSSISDYLTNICPGWRVDDLLFDDAAFSAAAEKGGGCDYEHEQVPCMDVDLFDVVAGRPAGKRGGGWYGGGGALGLETKVAADASIAVPTAAAAKQHQQGRVRERHWTNCDSDSDVFAVPEISFSQQPPAKKARPPPATSFWCF